MKYIGIDYSLIEGRPEFWIYFSTNPVPVEYTHKIAAYRISTALCAAASVPFRSGGVAASPQGEGLGERIGMEWVLDKSVFDFSFFGKSVLCISLFNCVGFSNVGKSGVGGCGCSNIT